MDNFKKAITTVIDWIGYDRRMGEDQRIKKVRKKSSKRKAPRRKK
tara:strand:+ start:1773 stop:1907 length:135 start_codon:yes stop_codon:yes gene_type:complete